ncbi:MAG: transaldolase [Bdellovibrionales bacterium]
MKASDLKIHIYADGANISEMKAAHKAGLVKGFTTNPTLMAKAGIKDYRTFAKEALAAIPDLPISFEVFSDEFDEMKRQAFTIAELGKNANVKIPIMNTKKQSSMPLIKELLQAGLKLNVTAIFTWEQITALHKTMTPQDDVIVSVFAGRIADAGVDPEPVMRDTVALYKDRPKAKVLWASPREVLNVIQADRCGCAIITCNQPILDKMGSLGKNLEEFSWETVKMFYDDARRSEFSL